MQTDGEEGEAAGDAAKRAKSVMARHGPSLLMGRRLALAPRPGRRAPPPPCLALPWPRVEPNSWTSAGLASVRGSPSPTATSAPRGHRTLRPFALVRSRRRQCHFTHA
eukprot:13029181-Alexandrium_andersonii.AAC.1